MNKLNWRRPGAWQSLFDAALTLTDHLERVINKPVWSFGGGTVLMLRLNHRQSKDIDLFVPDPQYLGYVNPRLSDPAESLTHDYVEAAEYIKLQLPAGEIDIVVGEPLTQDPWEEVIHKGRLVRVETNAEIIAKKMFHRGDMAKARDLFDLCAVAHADPQAIEHAAPFFAKHASTFISRLKQNAVYAQEEFAQIDRLQFERSFDECLVTAELILHGAHAR
ncbi:nucleotidyl transferase AbiEii/AbiGii toxin family protein [Caenimonas koreensis DSM 17982]|uniref:Nucleotidyl transferase AbiEii/AbiGii toxin family protein n=1 Tax=Caenimonas koreensis DSM 17982 TaxID=1121255 RepID=A0A844BG88_9BURK|nr:nucleotidyl transferase AbiEii/AbiGii toxin family protein [Caenimonas koreensis DSM 17982]